MINLSEMNRIINKAGKILEAIEKAEEHATSTTKAPTDMPHTTRRISLVEEGAVSIADLEAAYSEAVEIVQAMRRELAEMIEELPDIDDRAIMRLRYLKGYKPNAIAAATYNCERNVFIHVKKACMQLAEQFPDRFATDNSQDNSTKESGNYGHSYKCLQQKEGDETACHGTGR